MSSNSSDTDECDDMLFEDDFCLDESYTIHPSFERDIELFKSFFPREAITHREGERTLAISLSPSLFSFFDELGKLDVEMTVDLGFLPKTILAAWGLSHELPLTAKLKLPSSLYCYHNSWKVEVYQSLTNKETVVLVQLKKIVQSFSQWYLSKENKQSESTENSANNCSRQKDKGYFVEVCTKIQQRLKTLNDYCPICDRPNGATSMLKPAVCSHPLCVFSSQIMGVMCMLTEVIQTQPHVVKLLIEFTLAASSSSRRQLTFQPFPDLLDQATNDFLFANNDDGFRTLRKVMTFLCNFKLSGALSELELKEKLDFHHKHCYSLLKWIVSSNRSHIMYIPEAKQIFEMCTSSQFVMRNSPPLEDEQFRALAQYHGSCFAFHGSPLENWHSIVRQGLIIGSGSKLQLNGAAIGAGIYVTPCLDMALRYAGMCRATNVQRTAKGAMADQYDAILMKEKTEAGGFVKPVYCVALCEVITGPELKNKDKERWLVENSRHICTRFFFVYGSLGYTGLPVNSNSLEFEESVKKILSDI